MGWKGRIERPLTSSKALHQSLLDPLLLRTTKLKTESDVLSSSRSTTSMDVDIGGSRKLVVNDVVDGRDIESSSGDVGGEEDSVGRGLESA